MSQLTGTLLVSLLDSHPDVCCYGEVFTPPYEPGEWFDPRLPESMRLYIQRVPRDAARIAELETEVAAFLREIDAKVAALRSKYEPENDDAELPEAARLLMAGE